MNFTKSENIKFTLATLFTTNEYLKCTLYDKYVQLNLKFIN